MSNKSRIPSPARSQGVVTPRRYRPRSSRSVGSPARSNTSTRLTAIIQDAFEPSPISKRRSVLNDDTDIIAPSRQSWWKNLGENSREVLDVLQSKDIVEANNIMEEFDMEVLSQEKKNYTLDMQDSSDGESIRSIVVPHHKLFSEKENAAKKEYNNIMKNRETLNKSRAQKSSVEAYKDVSIETKNLFSQREKRSKPVFPAALLSVSANKTAAEKSIAPVEPKNQARNLFGNRPATKRKNMFIDFVVSDSEEDIPEIQAKVLTLKRPSLSNRRNSAVSNLNSPAQSMTDIEMDDWKLLPSSTMVEHQFEEETTPRRSRRSKVWDVNNMSKTDALRKLRDNNNMDNLLDVDDEINTTLKGPADKRGSLYFPDNKQNTLISKTMTENVPNQSITKSLDIMAQNKDNSKHSKTTATLDKNDLINENLKDKENKALGLDMDDQSSEDELDNSRLRYEEDEDRSDKSNKKTEENINIKNKEEDKLNKDKQVDVTLEKQKNLDRKSKYQDESRRDNSDSNKEHNENTDVEFDEVEQQKDNVSEIAQGEDIADQDESKQNQDPEKSEIEHDESNKQEDKDDQEESEVEQENSEVEKEESEIEQEDSNKQQYEDEQEDSEVEQDESEVEQEVSTADPEDSAEEQQESEVEPQGSEIEQEEDRSEMEENREQEEMSEAEQDHNDTEKGDSANQSKDIVNNTETNIQNQAADNVDGNVENDISNENDKISVISNSPHEANRNKSKKTDNAKSPEAVLKDKSGQGESFFVKGRNTSVRKTKSVILKNLDLRPSLAPVRESMEFSDGNRDSSANNSGWDSHRTTRKTMRQTFGRDFTPRKSLRTLVMEKSAKRQTNLIDNDEISKMPQANSTEYPQFESMAEKTDNQMDDHTDGCMDDHAASHMDDHTDGYNHEHMVDQIVDQMEVEESTEESNHEVSKRTRQTTLETYLQKIKTDNMEKKRKLEEEIRNSLKTSSQKFNHLFKVPQKPAIRRAIKTNNNTKPESKTIKNKHFIPLDILPAEVLEDLKYKPPKRYQPKNASWVTKRLYKFLETKLEPHYDYKARVRAEKLVEAIFNFTREIRRFDVASGQAVDSLKHEMARHHIVDTHFEFYEFVKNYMPRDVRNKVVPDIVNKIPLPRPNVFAAIIR